jgi:hypothetical protein
VCLERITAPRALQLRGSTRTDPFFQRAARIVSGDETKYSERQARGLCTATFPAQLRFMDEGPLRGPKIGISYENNFRAIEADGMSFIPAISLGSSPNRPIGSESYFRSGWADWLCQNRG